MGGTLSEICDCENKDPRDEINDLKLPTNNSKYINPYTENQNLMKGKTKSTISTVDNSKYLINDLYITQDILTGKLSEKYKINTTIKFTGRNKENKINISPKKFEYFSNPEKNNNNNNLYTSSSKNFSSNNSISSKLKKMLKRNEKSKIYIGNEKNNKKDGFGLQIWNNQTFYIGNYKNNQANGYGKFIVGKNKYKGEFKNDEANGFGIFNNKETNFEGYWLDDMQYGYGEEKWKDGSVYKGEYYFGKKNGIGKYEWADGNIYEGEFCNNAFQGYGIYYFNDNKYYFGQWKNNKKCGYGEFYSKDKIFIGNYFDDKKDGIGVYFVNNGQKIFIGVWKDGIKKGPGKYIHDNKIKFGFWENEQKVNVINNENDFFEMINKNLCYSKYIKIYMLSKNDLINYINRNNIREIINDVK